MNEQEAPLEEEIEGWCIYCKEVIEEGDDFVSKDDNLYHVDCYKLLYEDNDE